MLLKLAAIFYTFNMVVASTIIFTGTYQYLDILPLTDIHKNFAKRRKLSVLKKTCNLDDT